MTDSKALIKRLRECDVPLLILPSYKTTRQYIREAADYIEKLEADNARLREKLEKMQRGRDRYREEYYEARKTFRDTQP